MRRSPVVSFGKQQQEAVYAAGLHGAGSLERGTSLCALSGLFEHVTRSMARRSPSGISLLITYSSTNQRIRSGISKYAEIRTIGRLGNRWRM